MWLAVKTFAATGYVNRDVVRWITTKCDTVCSWVIVCKVGEAVSNDLGQFGVRFM